MSQGRTLINFQCNNNTEVLYQPFITAFIVTVSCKQKQTFSYEL